MEMSNEDFGQQYGALTARIGVDLPVLMKGVASKQDRQLGNDVRDDDNTIANTYPDLHVLESFSAYTVSMEISKEQGRIVVGSR